MNRDQKLQHNHVTRWLTLVVFALTILFVPGTRAAAQGWTTNGSNISNTNTGGVGIGTTDLTDVLVAGDDKLKIVDGAMTFSFRDFSSGQGYFALGSSVNGIKGFVGHTNTADGFTLGTFSNHKLTIRTNSVNRLTINTAGDIGISTTNPLDKLHLYGTDPALRFETSTNTVKLKYVTSGGGAAERLGFWGGGGTELVSFMNNGNVGIGTTSPVAKLDVNGDINVSGNINAKYQDIAEWVPAARALPAGTVVVLDSTKSNQVTASSLEYDTRVAGVISERPGLALGEAGKDKVLVATTGRVKVKVDATRSPIRIGDLLVTSDVEGVAMKSEPLMIQGRPFHSPGTLLGKALEPLEKGTGEILVLLSLQ